MTQTAAERASVVLWGVPDDVAATVSALLAPEVAVAANPSPAEEVAAGHEVLEARTTIVRGSWPPGTVAVVPGPLRTRWLSRAAGWTHRRRGVALVSTHGLDLDAAIDRERLAKVIAHEAGHVLGLRHCRRRGCLAARARDRTALDELAEFCPSCRHRLARGSDALRRRGGGP